MIKKALITAGVGVALLAGAAGGVHAKTASALPGGHSYFALQTVSAPTADEDTGQACSNPGTANEAGNCDTQTGTDGADSADGAAGAADESSGETGSDGPDTDNVQSGP